MSTITNEESTEQIPIVVEDQQYIPKETFEDTVIDWIQGFVNHFFIVTYAPREQTKKKTILRPSCLGFLFGCALCAYFYNYAGTMYGNFILASQLVSYITLRYVIKVDERIGNTDIE